MKKILSLMLVAMLLVSVIPTAFAFSGPCVFCDKMDATTCPQCEKGEVYCPTVKKCAACNYSIPEDTNLAADGTTIELVGSGSEAYTVTVPAELQPGQSGTVKASGTWESGKTLKVTAPNSVTVSYGDQTMPVGITFAGITLAGNDLAAVEASADVTVADATALFGTWTGTLNYTVVLE